MVRGHSITITPDSLREHLHLQAVAEDATPISDEDIKLALVTAGYQGPPSSVLKKNLFPHKCKFLTEIIGKVFFCKTSAHDVISREMMKVLAALILRKPLDYARVLFDLIAHAVHSHKTTLGRVLSLYFKAAHPEVFLAGEGSHLHRNKSITPQLFVNWSKTFTLKDTSVTVLPSTPIQSISPQDPPLPSTSLPHLPPPSRASPQRSLSRSPQRSDTPDIPIHSPLHRLSTPEPSHPSTPPPSTFTIPEAEPTTTPQPTALPHQPSIHRIPTPLLLSSPSLIPPPARTYVRRSRHLSSATSHDVPSSARSLSPPAPQSIRQTSISPPVQQTPQGSSDSAHSHSSEQARTAPPLTSSLVQELHKLIEEEFNSHRASIISQLASMGVDVAKQKLAYDRRLLSIDKHLTSIDTSITTLTTALEATNQEVALLRALLLERTFPSTFYTDIAHWLSTIIVEATKGERFAEAYSILHPTPAPPLVTPIDIPYHEQPSSSLPPKFPTQVSTEPTDEAVAPVVGVITRTPETVTVDEPIPSVLPSSLESTRSSSPPRRMSLRAAAKGVAPAMVVAPTESSKGKRKVDLLIPSAEEIKRDKQEAKRQALAKVKEQVEKRAKKNPQKISITPVVPREMVSSALSPISEKLTEDAFQAVMRVVGQAFKLFLKEDAWLVKNWKTDMVNFLKANRDPKSNRVPKGTKGWPVRPKVYPISVFKRMKEQEDILHQQKLLDTFSRRPGLKFPPLSEQRLKAQAEGAEVASQLLSEDLDRILHSDPKQVRGIGIPEDDSFTYSAPEKVTVFTKAKDQTEKQPSPPPPSA